jgi:hypothetical protein
MSDDYKIHVDGGQPAMLNNGAGALTDYPSLQEAVLAWRRLPPEQKVRATIKVIRGPVYAAYQIDRIGFITNRNQHDGTRQWAWSPSELR